MPWRAHAFDNHAARMKHLRGDPSGHRERADSAGADQRVNLPAGQDFHQLTKENAGGGIENERE